MQPQIISSFQQYAGVPLEVHHLWRKQDTAVADFRAALGTVIRLLNRNLTESFDRGEWTFRTNGQTQQFSATLSGDWCFPGSHQTRIDRTLIDAGFAILMNDEDMRVWVAETPNLKRAA